MFADGALSAREKALIALAVAHAVQCPYCIDAYSQECLEKGADLEQMTEAVHVAAAIRGGASLVHGVQMLEHVEEGVACEQSLRRARRAPLADAARQLAAAVASAMDLLGLRRRGGDFARALGARRARTAARRPHRDLPDQRRQALQHDVPSLPRRRRARTGRRR